MIEDLTEGLVVNGFHEELLVGHGFKCCNIRTKGFSRSQIIHGRGICFKRIHNDIIANVKPFKRLDGSRLGVLGSGFLEQSPVD